MNQTIRKKSSNSFLKKVKRETQEKTQTDTPIRPKSTKYLKQYGKNSIYNDRQNQTSTNTHTNVLDE